MGRIAQLDLLLEHFRLLNKLTLKLIKSSDMCRCHQEVSFRLFAKFLFPMVSVIEGFHSMSVHSLHHLGIRSGMFVFEIS